MLPTYKPSGKYSMSFLTMLPAAMAAAAVLGVVYQLGIHYIGYVKINALLWIGCGFVAGWIAAYAMRLAKCRNRMIAAAAGLVIGVCPVVAGHVTEYWVLTRNAGFTVPVSRYVEVRVAEGWTIGSRSSSASKSRPDISGAGVWAMWGIEALGIIGTAAFFAASRVAKPFCEACEAWMDKPLAQFTIPWVNPGAAERVKGATDLAGLLAVAPEPPDPAVAVPTAQPTKAMPAPPKGTKFVSLTYTLMGCSMCKDFATLTVEQMTIVQAGARAVSTKKVVLHNAIMLDSESRAKVESAAAVWTGA